MVKTIVTKEEFKKRLADIYGEGNYDTEISHCEADDLLIETLESFGYDLAIFKNATRWYA
jgi:hypothetical protein